MEMVDVGQKQDCFKGQEGLNGNGKQFGVVTRKSIRAIAHHSCAMVAIEEVRADLDDASKAYGRPTAAGATYTLICGTGPSR